MVFGPTSAHKKILKYLALAFLLNYVCKKCGRVILSANNQPDVQEMCLNDLVLHTIEFFMDTKRLNDF